MPIRTTRFCALQLACFVACRSPCLDARWRTDESQSAKAASADQDKIEIGKVRPHPAADYSGMYSFLRDGEFVQLTVEDHGHVIGFVSRYADAEGDGGFLDHFLKSGKLDGNQLEFTSEAVRGVSFEFRGTVERGEGKSRDRRSILLAQGTLVENTIDETKKTSSHSREVVLKSFPQDLAPPRPEKK